MIFKTQVVRHTRSNNSTNRNTRTKGRADSNPPSQSPVDIDWPLFIGSGSTISITKSEKRSFGCCCHSWCCSLLNSSRKTKALWVLRLMLCYGYGLQNFNARLFQTPSFRPSLRLGVSHSLSIYLSIYHSEAWNWLIFTLQNWRMERPIWGSTCWRQRNVCFSSLT